MLKFKIPSSRRRANIIWSHENSSNKNKISETCCVSFVLHMGWLIIRPTTPSISLFQSNGETKGNANATNMLALPFLSKMQRKSAYMQTVL